MHKQNKGSERCYNKETCLICFNLISLKFVEPEMTPLLPLSLTPIKSHSEFIYLWKTLTLVTARSRGQFTPLTLSVTRQLGSLEDANSRKLQTSSETHGRAPDV